MLSLLITIIYIDICTNYNTLIINIVCIPRVTICDYGVYTQSDYGPIVTICDYGVYTQSDYM